MVDVTGIVWDWWASVGWWLIPVVVLAVIGFCSHLADIDLIGDLAGFFSLMWLFCGGLIIMGLIPSFSVAAEEGKIATVQLEEQGYERVTLDWPTTFTASKDGEYFQGAFFYEGDHKYRVLELTE